jgi:hypothetical protein
MRFCFLFFGLAVAVGASVLQGPVPAAAAGVDHRLFGELLGDHVEDGVVDYAGIQKEEEKLDRYLKRLERIDPATLSAGEAFADYVNAYNAWTIKLILSRYPDIGSIKELGGFHDKSVECFDT